MGDNSLRSVSYNAMLGVSATNRSGTDAEYEGHWNWKVKVIVSREGSLPRTR